MKRLLITLCTLIAISAKVISQDIQPIVPVSQLPYWETPKEYGRPGWEERGPEYAKWLAPSVRVTKGGGGSGTICYYDAAENWAYVISCGHLFSMGYKSRQDYQKKPDTRKIEVFYHNEKRLSQPDVYEGEVLCHVWDGFYDVSLLRFKPKWENPWVAQIAPVDYKLEQKQYHSCGCDGLTETAHYLVTYIQERNTRSGVTEILTQGNGPRGGRSGGGTLTDDGQLVFICSRGDGKYAYWSSLNQIHKFLTQEGFKDVLEGVTLANKIPIIDRNNPQGKYSQKYIPSPK